MAWDRHTGEVKAFATFQPNVHRWCNGLRMVEKYSIPENYAKNFNPALYDLEA